MFSTGNKRINILRKILAALDFLGNTKEYKPNALMRTEADRRIKHTTEQAGGTKWRNIYSIHKLIYYDTFLCVGQGWRI